jgi:nucleoside-diphosphate-sugar epimerase
MRLLVTGSSGFMGRSACLVLHERGFLVRAFSRTHCEWPSGIDVVNLPTLSSLTDSENAFKGVDCVLHLAGRAHVMNESAQDPLFAFRQANVSETLALAYQASSAGVRRFIFVSSIKVNGEIALPSAPFSEADDPNPQDAYALSKYEAELGLFRIAAETGMEVVVVRPPLVYGPNVKGNFRVMMKLLLRRIPLPLALVDANQRSLVSLGNLTDFLALCASHSEAAGRIFVVSDQHDVSTAGLLRKLGELMNSPARLFPVPLSFMGNVASLTGRQSAFQKLCGSLVVDSSNASRLLGWSPPLSLDEGLRRAVIDFPA